MIEHRRQALLAITILTTAFVSGCSADRSAKKLPIGNVEAPKASDNLKATIHVSGWALADQGVERVDAYWDGSLAGSGKTGGSRPDVKKVYPNYQDADKGGFDFTLDVSALSPGQHELTVQARSNDDAVRELFRSAENITR